METPKFRWLDLGKLVEGLLRSADAGKVEIKPGDYVEENATKLNAARSHWKGVYPDIRGRIPLNIGGYMGYIFVEQGIKHRYMPRRYERYERLKLRVKGGIRINGVSDFKSEYSITEELNGKNADVYGRRKDYVKDGGHWVESDLSRALLSTHFIKDSVTVTTRQEADRRYPEWHLLLGRLHKIFQDIQF